MNTLTLKGIQSIEALLKINLNVTRVELFEPLYKGEQEVVAKTLTTIQWLLQGNFNYHAVRKRRPMRACRVRCRGYFR